MARNLHSTKPKEVVKVSVVKTAIKNKKGK